MNATSDRTLIEAAAKLMGLDDAKWESFPGMEERYGFDCAVFSDKHAYYFNPLVSPSDREAVLMALWEKYDVDIRFKDSLCTVFLFVRGSRILCDARVVEMLSDHANNRDQAYAYALLRAVAQVMKGE